MLVSTYVTALFEDGTPQVQCFSGDVKPDERWLLIATVEVATVHSNSDLAVLFTDHQSKFLSSHDKLVVESDKNMKELEELKDYKMKNEKAKLKSEPDAPLV